MAPLSAVQHPRIYHKLIPNEVLYEDLTVIDEEHTELEEEVRLFLEQIGHALQRLPTAGAVSQLIVHNLQKPVLSLQRKANRKAKSGHSIFHGRLIAVSDPRKNGCPAGL